MDNLVPFASISHLFGEFTESAWRLETRRGYATDRRGENFRRWKAGEPIDDSRPDPWRQQVAEQTARGRHFGRVRLVDEPLTEGQRFLLARAPVNEAAGEEIRHLPRRHAAGLHLPGFDFWLFDSRMVARFVFDDDDTTLGVVLSESSDDVAAACQAREAAWPPALGTAEFTRQVRSTV